MRGMRTPIGMLCALLALAACDDDGDLIGPDPGEEIRRIGEVGYVSGTVPDEALQVPATVEVGQEFEARVATQGNGCVRRADEEVELDDRHVTIRPFDFERIGVACTEQLKRIPHVVHLRFDSPGEVLVRAVAGLGTPSGDSRPLVVLEETVKVEP